MKLDLVVLAEYMVGKHNEKFPNFSLREWQLRQGTAVSEEAGEFCGHLNRYLGMHREVSTLSDVEAELADVVLSAYVAARRLNIDLDAAIQKKFHFMVERGWKDPR